MADLTQWPGFGRKWIKAYWGKEADIYQEKGKWILKIPVSSKSRSRDQLTLNLLKAMKEAGYQAYTHHQKGKWHSLDVLNSIIWFKHQNKKLCFVLFLRAEAETDMPFKDGLAWYIKVIPVQYDAAVLEYPLQWKHEGWLKSLFGF